MYIIKLEATDSGSRPPLQEWNTPTAPEGYALCPDKFSEIFYSTKPSGFVNIVVKDGVVTDMTVNQNAVNRYIANLPEPEEIISEPTTDEVLNTLLGV